MSLYFMQDMKDVQGQGEWRSQRDASVFIPEHFMLKKGHLFF